MAKRPVWKWGCSSSRSWWGGRAPNISYKDYSQLLDYTRGQHAGSPLAIPTSSTRKWQGIRGARREARAEGNEEWRPQRGKARPFAQPLCPSSDSALSRVQRVHSLPHPGGFPTIDLASL